MDDGVLDTMQVLIVTMSFYLFLCSTVQYRPGFFNHGKHVERTYSQSVSISVEKNRDPAKGLFDNHSSYSKIEQSDFWDRKKLSHAVVKLVPACLPA